MQKNLSANIERYETSWKLGLTNNQVKQRKEDRLENKIKSNKFADYFKIIFKDLFNFYNILLLILGIILILCGEIANCFFMVVMISNTIINLFNDLKAKIKVDSLKIINESKIEVIRNGKSRNVKITDIVLDDVIHIKSGNQVPCDGIIIKGDGKFDESILTGESLKVAKSEKARVLSGTYLMSGDVYIRALEVGKNNYANKLSEKSKKFKSPKALLNIQIDKLFKSITLVVLVFGVATILTKNFNDYIFRSWAMFKENIAPVCGALISMIPSGMYLLISTTLSVSAITLATKKVLLNDPYSIETLARVDTICIDKTGTITDGDLSVYKYELFKNSKFDKNYFEALMSSYNAVNSENNFTAIALENYFGKKQIFIETQKIHFDSKNKYGAVSLKNIGTICVGAFGFVPLKNNDIRKKVDNYSRKGFRVLIVAYSEKSVDKKRLPDDFEPLAIVLLQDHIRDNIKKIINEFQDNNIDIKVISGDNVLTVSEVAKIAGIKNYNKYISLEGMSDDEVKNAATQYSIFGRVTPEQKRIIISTLQKIGKTVGMFGDGVNDILAMKKSNVSVTVGCASQAAKDVSNIILYNNDFGTLPEVMLHGRRIINNLQRTCSLFLNKTVFAVLANLGFLITSILPGLRLTYPLTPKNFYGWEIFSIGVAAFFLALERNNEKLVKGNFISNILKEAIPNGTILAAEIMLIYILGGYVGIRVSNLSTYAVYLISIASIVFLWEVSSPLSLYRAVVLVADVVVVLLLFLFSYLTPFNILGLSTDVTKWRLIVITFGAVSIFIIIMMVKILIGKKRKEKVND